MTTPEQAAKLLVRACSGRLHGRKAGRILGLHARRGANADLFSLELDKQFPGLDVQMRADILAHLFPNQKTIDEREAVATTEREEG